MIYEDKIKNSRNISDIFEVVKELVNKSVKLEQAGLLVGLSDLGMYNKGFIGAYYSLNANMIIINKKPLKRILETNPQLYKYYLFHIILHEYIHSVGFYDEKQARQVVYEISKNYFGQDHQLTQLALNLEKFLPNLTYPSTDFIPPENPNIEFVRGIDRKNLNYIG